MNNENASTTSATSAIAAAKTNSEIYQPAVDMPLSTSKLPPSVASAFGTQPDTTPHTIYVSDENDEVLQKRKLDESNEGDEGLRKRMCDSSVTNYAIGDAESHRTFPVTGIFNSTGTEIFGCEPSNDPVPVTIFSETVTRRFSMGKINMSWIKMNKSK